MKRILTFLLLLLPMLAHGAGATPILRGLLQSDLNGNQKAITNLSGLSGSFVIPQTNVAGLPSPVVENSLTTNALAPGLVYIPSTRILQITVPAGSLAGGISMKSNVTQTLQIGAHSGDADFHDVTVHAISATTLTPNTIIHSDGIENMVSLANGANGTALGISNSVPAYIYPATFAGTNTAPAVTNTPFAWVSVQVAGMTNQFRIPLYQ